MCLVVQVTPYAGDAVESEGKGAQAMQVQSRGGAINVRGLDGSLSIDSGGGDVVLQCTQNMRHAIVRSHGGSVSVFAQPDMQIQLHVVGGKGVEIPEGCTVTGPHSQQTPNMVQGCLHVREPGSAGAEESNEGGAASNSAVTMRFERAEPHVQGVERPAAEKPLLVVVAGDGGVQVLVRSWRDSMLQRITMKRAAA
jgi:hypothetical protein